MASKRHQRRRQCRAKRAYDDYESAFRAMVATASFNRTRDIQVIREEGCSMRVYRCGDCGSYHFGHFRMPRALAPNR